MKSPSFPPSPLPPTHATKTKKRKRVVAIVVLFVFIVFLSKVFSSSSSSSSSSVLLATTENGSSSSSSNNNNNNNNNKDDENLRALKEIFLEEESQSSISDDPLDLQFLGLQSSLGGASAACKFQFEIASWRETRLFFALHPECRHLDKCEAELPSQTTLSKQVFDSGGADTIDEKNEKIIKHNTYVKRFDEDLRYAHMATIAKMKDKRMILLYQAAPGASTVEKKDSGEEEKESSGGNEGDTTYYEYKLATEGLQDQHIEYTQSKDLEGKQWTPPVKLPIYNDAAVWSPVVHIDNNQVYVFYSESTGCKKAVPCKPPQCPKGEVCEVNSHAEMCHHTPKSLWVPGGDIKYIKSIGDPADNKWTKAVTILSQGEGGGIPKVIANSLIVMKKTGHWVLPYWREQQNAIEDGTCTRKPEFKGSSGPDCRWNKRSKCMTGAQPFSGVLVSENRGKTWQPRGQITQSNTSLIEGSIAELNDGRIIQVFRTRVGCVYKSYSKDEGKSWTEPEPMPVPNPNSKVFLMRLEPNGELLLAFNNMKNQYRSRRGATKCRACRTHLHVAISRDGDGNEWETIARLEDEIGYEAPRIHYPYMVQKDASSVLVAYTRFYLGKRKGLTSLDQGVKVAEIDLKSIV
tara:strand:+ start:273 stop:2168 length:1896 start_codon:yes stop_codon:yes gene_type:complete